MEKETQEKESEPIMEHPDTFFEVIQVGTREKLILVSPDEPIN